MSAHIRYIAYRRRARPGLWALPLGAPTESPCRSATAFSHPWPCFYVDDRQRLLLPRAAPHDATAARHRTAPHRTAVSRVAPDHARHLYSSRRVRLGRRV